MRRFSIPIDEQLFHEYDKKVPHGMKATVIRGLLRIILTSPSSILWDVAEHERNPELFTITKRSQNEGV